MNQNLIAGNPDAFTEDDIERIRAAQSSGKRVYEKLLESRREGWMAAREIAQNQHLLKSFSVVDNIRRG